VRSWTASLLKKLKVRTYVIVLIIHRQNYPELGDLCEDLLMTVIGSNTIWLSVAIRYMYVCTVTGEVPIINTHCAGFLSYSHCRYSVHYKQNTCCSCQCHGLSLLTYMLFEFEGFLKLHKLRFVQNYLLTFVYVVHKCIIIWTSMYTVERHFFNKSVRSIYTVIWYICSDGCVTGCQREERGLCLRDFKIIEHLGKGGFGKVVLAKKKSTGGRSSSKEVLALKLVPK
jgi:hypothetical protein